MMSQAISPIANRPIWVRKADWRGETKPPFGAPLNRDHWAAKNLVASYLFNEGAGRTVYDSSGNENHGTMIGFGAEDTATSGWVPGSHGGAVALSRSTNNYIRTGYTNIFNFSKTQPLSIIAGVQQRIIPIDWQSNTILSTVANDIYYQGFNISYGSTKQYSFGLGDYAGSNRRISVISNGVYEVNDIHNITITYAGIADSQKIYINGKDDTGVKSNDMTPISYPANMYLAIGRRGNISDSYANSNISYVNIYNRALSPDEISYLAAFPYCMYGG